MNVSKFFKSFNYAIEGIFTATKEQNLRFHLVSALVVVIAGFYTGFKHDRMAHPYFGDGARYWYGNGQ